MPVPLLHTASARRCGPTIHQEAQSASEQLSHLHLTTPGDGAVVSERHFLGQLRIRRVTNSCMRFFGHAAKTNSTRCWYIVMSSFAGSNVGTKLANWLLTPYPLAEASPEEVSDMAPGCCSLAAPLPM